MMSYKIHSLFADLVKLLLFQMLRSFRMYYCICIVMASSPSLSMTRTFVYPANRYTSGAAYTRNPYTSQAAKPNG